MVRAADREPAVSVGAGSVTVDVKRMIRASPRAYRRTVLRATASCKYLHDACRRVGPVQHAGRTSHDLDSLDVVGGEVAEIEIAAGRVHCNAIDENFGVTAFTTAQKERSERAV